MTGRAVHRGGDEKKIRTATLNQDLVDAVIGLGPNLFYGTGIPACILVLRAPDAKPAERRGKVLLINADREYTEGRAQNYLHAEHIEKIVSAWRAFEDVEGFARVVSRDELAKNDDNLNIRRYADNAPPPEPHDVRAHLRGGIPGAEIERKRATFEAHGLDLERILTPRGDGYHDLVADLTERAQIKTRIASDVGVVTRERALRAAVDQWWTLQLAKLEDLPKTKELMKARALLLTSFEQAASSARLLDRFQVSGVVATWWGEVQNDLRAVAARGFEGLIEGWYTSILASMADEKSTDDPLDHRFVKKRLPEYLAELASLEAKKAELSAKRATRKRPKRRCQRRSSPTQRQTARWSHHRNPTRGLAERWSHHRNPTRGLRRRCSDHRLMTPRVAGGAGALAWRAPARPDVIRRPRELLVDASSPPSQERWGQRG